MRGLIILVYCFAYIIIGMIFYVCLLKFNSTRREENRMPEAAFVPMVIFWPMVAPIFLIIYCIFKLWKIISPILFKIMRYKRED